MSTAATKKATAAAAKAAPKKGAAEAGVTAPKAEDPVTVTKAEVVAAKTATTAAVEPVKVEEPVVETEKALETPAIQEKPTGETAAGTVFEWTATEARESVKVTGTFTNWVDHIDCEGEGSAWKASVTLAPGKYLYKYIVDGEWCYDLEKPSETDESGNVNNVVIVE